MKRTLRLSLACAAALIVPAATTVVTPGEAQGASVGWAYIAFPTWLGNCGAAGGSVYAVQAMVGGTDVTRGFDFGDDIIYAKVKLKQSQDVSAQVWCSQRKPKSKPARFLLSHAVSQKIKPTRDKQTAWVGPGGVRYN